MDINYVDVRGTKGDHKKIASALDELPDETFGGILSIGLLAKIEKGGRKILIGLRGEERDKHAQIHVNIPRGSIRVKGEYERLYFTYKGTNYSVGDYISFKFRR